MTLVNNNKIKLINFLSKYSYSQIYVELQSKISPTQVNPNYLSDTAKTDLLLHNISARLESFALSCKDLQNPENQKKVMKTYNYFWGSNKENAELRGIQADYMSRIFRDVSKSSNIDFALLPADLSAAGLGFSQGLNTKLPLFVPRLLVPSIFHRANSESMKNAFEVTIGMIHSSVTGDTLTLTNDQPFINTDPNKTVVHNAPKKQVVCDSVRETNGLFVLEDFKFMSVYKYLLMKYPMVVSIGAQDKVLEDKAQRNVVSNALIRVNIQASSISSSNPSKNQQDIIDDLKDSLISGDVIHTREVLGIPVAYSNKFIDPVEE